MKYKLVAYKNEDNKVYYISKSNNLEFFDRYKNKTNYKIQIYKRGRKWELIYDELNGKICK